MRPELELLDELLEELALPSGPLQAARAIKLKINTLRVKIVNACMAGSNKAGVKPGGLINNNEL